MFNPPVSVPAASRVGDGTGFAEFLKVGVFHAIYLNAGYARLVWAYWRKPLINVPSPARQASRSVTGTGRRFPFPKGRDSTSSARQ